MQESLTHQLSSVISTSLNVYSIGEVITVHDLINFDGLQSLLPRGAFCSTRLI